ncbi:hypothetical protein FKM82_004509 [Ascaphus truei]
MVSEGGSIHDQGILSSSTFLPFSFPDEHRNRCLPAQTEREFRLEAVRSTFLAAYNTTIGLKSVSPSPSGAIGGLLEQFARVFAKSSAVCSPRIARGSPRSIEL